jgi:tetratricopeptide (TPR) repeat protein
VPTLKTPGWRYSAGGQVIGNVGTERLARDHYYQGHYQASINAYQGYLRRNPGATGARQDLAWVYAEAGETQTARQQYQVALDQYREDLRRGDNVGSAQHGERTCESAINALETQ